MEKAESQAYSEFLSRAEWRQSKGLHKLVTNNILNKILCATNLDRSVQVLEVGAGTGLLAEILEEKGFKNYSAVEPCSELAKNLCKKLSDTNIFTERLPNLAKEFDEKYDLVIALHVIEHAESGYKAREWIQELSRCTKPGGFIALAAPCALDYGLEFWDVDWSHGFPTTLRNLTQIANDLNLEVVEGDKTRAGNCSLAYKFIAIPLKFLIPFRLIDRFSSRLVGRSLGTGLKLAIFNKNVFMVLRRKKL